MRSVLVIRSAREAVLQAYLALGSGDRITVLGHGPAPDRRVDFIEAPSGALRWRRFDRGVRAALRRRRWSKIVVLHNLSDESYAGVLAIAARVSPTTPLRIFQANGVERAYPSWLHFAAIRGPQIAFASVICGVLITALLPFHIRRRWSRATAGTREVAA